MIVTSSKEKSIKVILYIVMYSFGNFPKNGEINV